MSVEQQAALTVEQMAAELELAAVTPVRDRGIVGGIASDLLSDILASAGPDFVWVTIQTHRNVAAVAAAQGLAAVIITAGRKPSPDLVALAQREQITIFTTTASTFAVAGELYQRGVR